MEIQCSLQLQPNCESEPVYPAAGTGLLILDSVGSATCTSPTPPPPQPLSVSCGHVRESDGDQGDWKS